MKNDQSKSILSRNGDLFLKIIIYELNQLFQNDLIIC